MHLSERNKGWFPTTGPFLISTPATFGRGKGYGRVESADGARLDQIMPGSCSATC